MKQQIIIDLHSHSKCSDGELSPVELINLAKAHGVQIFSITDHDNMDSYFHIQKMKQLGQFPNNMIYIPGVELFTISQVDQSQQHFLIYFPFLAVANWPVTLEFHKIFFKIDEPVCSDSQRESFERFFDYLKQLEFARVKRIVQYFENLNNYFKWGFQLQEFADFAHIDLKKMSATSSLGRPHIAKFLQLKGKVANIKDAFRTVLQDSLPCFVKQKVDFLEQVCQQVTKFGAKCFLAHPNLEEHDILKINARIESAMQFGMTGIEKYHSQTDSDQFKRFKGPVSIGSDYHNEQRGYKFGNPSDNLIMKEWERKELILALFGVNPQKAGEKLFHSQPLCTNAEQFLHSSQIGEYLSRKFAK